MGADNESKTAIALVDPLVGTIFDKRFRVEERIAAGGFGAIYRATHVKSGHPIALKILLPTLAQDLGIVARFRREGDTLTSLRNPHTITAYELGQAADRTLFIVMELLHGKTLFERYEENGPFEWRRMARIARQVCESLDEAHARGIVHRDLKPTNIHLEEVDGDPDYVKVLDFGIAKILQGSDFDASDITNAGTMIGTIDYMSPEQMVGGQVSGQTDIYTLGIVMYEMIAGVRPFPEAKSAASALAAMLKTTPQALFLRAPVSEQISKIVMRCLERETNRRYRTVAELMKDLDEVIGEGGSANVVLDPTKTFELDAAERAIKKARSDDEATTFTPPPEKLLQELRTPGVERIPEWDDDDENATTAAERMDPRAVSRAETNVIDGIDPHGPTVAARPIRDSDANAMIRREEAHSAKTPTVRRDLDALRRDIDALAQARPPTRLGTDDARTPRVDSDGARTPRVDNGAVAAAARPPTRLDSDGLDPKTPPFQRADSDSLDPRTPPFQRVDKHEVETAPRSRSELDDIGEAKTQRAGFDSDSQSRGKASRSAKGNPERSVRGTIEAPRPKSPTRQPTPNPDAARPKSGTRPPPTPDPDGGRSKTITAPPPAPPIPLTPPVRPLAARNFPTPVPQVVVAPFSSTPRAPAGLPTPPPGSLPPGVPMPPGRPTPMPGSLPPGVPAPPTHVPTPPGTPPYPGVGPIPNPFAPNAAPSSNPSGNPFAPNAAPSSNPSANPFAPTAAPGSNPSGNPFAPSAAPSSNPAGSPFTVPGSNPSANPFAVPGSNPSANPFGVPGSNPGANPFPSPGIPTTPYAGGQSNPFLSTSPAPIPPSVQRGQYDIHGMAARETMIRRLVWIVALVLAAGIGIVVAMR